MMSIAEPASGSSDGRDSLGAACAPDDVANAYWVLLGRAPESDSVTQRPEGTSLLDLVLEFLTSAEFQWTVVRPFMNDERPEDIELPAGSLDWAALRFGIIEENSASRWMQLSAIVGTMAARLRTAGAEWDPELLSRRMRSAGEARLAAGDRTAIVHAFRLFLGRSPQSEQELAAKLGIAEEALVAELVSSVEFTWSVARKLIAAEADVRHFAGRPDAALVDWAAGLKSISSAGRKRAAVAADWRQLYLALFTDPLFRKSLARRELGFNLAAFIDAIANWPLVFTLSQCEPFELFDGDGVSDLGAENLPDYELVRSSVWFDAAYYASENPGFETSGLDPASHYLQFGLATGRRPSADFNAQRYIAENPDIAARGINPLVHWLRIGRWDRRVSPVEPGGRTLDHGEGGGLAAWEHEIAASGLFDEHYYLASYPDVRAANIDPLIHYLQHGAAELRNPSATFDTHYYVSMRPEAGDAPGGPLCHYLREGRKRGFSPRPPGSVVLGRRPLSVEQVRTALGRKKIAIHAHLFYPDLAEDFAWAFKALPFPFDLFVSTCASSNTAFLEKIFARILPHVKTQVATVENRGRDIAPLFVTFAHIWRDYDFVCHVHSKRSAHTGFGNKWRAWLIDNLFGDQNVAVACVDHLVRNSDCGMLFPDNYFEIKKFSVWGEHQASILDAMARFGYASCQLPRFANFAAGSMAWFRTAAIRTIADANLHLEEFPNESGQEDATLAHAIERALPLVANAEGYAATRYSFDRRVRRQVSDPLYASSEYQDAVGERWMRDTPAIALNLPRPVAPRTSLFNRSCLEINWIIPDFGLGAGGHMTIFRMVEFLGQFGHRQTIWIQNARNHRSPLDAKRKIQKHYRPIDDSVVVRYLPDDVRQISGDVVIATDCWTVFPATNATNVKSRFYFIQDYEPMFHAMGENYFVALATYDMGLNALCAGAWLEQKAIAHGMWTRTWTLASDPHYYFPAQRAADPGRRKRIAFYCRSYTPRRATRLGLAAFEELHRRGVEFEVVLFGEDRQERNFPFNYVDFGIGTPEDLAGIYRDCDLGVVFSTTNYSLVPLEMMACSLPVVEIDAESTRAAFPEGTCELALPTPHAVADAIEKLLNDEPLAQANAKRASAFVKDLSWEKSARIIEAALIERLLEDGARPIEPAAVCAPALVKPFKASVIIPTFNAGEAFGAVLKRVAEQRTDFAYDVLVIDSSSTDGTADRALSVGGNVRVESIPQAEFQHGRTRNLAISRTDGAFVAVLTQDALPADEHWLQALIDGFSASDRVAGVIGRHVAYPEHGPFVARDLERMFQRMQEFGPVFSFERGLPSFLYPGGVEWRMTMHFYSDNNSAMSRAVWKDLPYPEIDWGEDQVWAWEALKLGFEKAYAHDAVVYHSHRDSQSKQYDVAVHEGRLFASHFGYDLYGSPRAAAQHIENLLHAETAYATRHGVSTDWLKDYYQACRISVEGRLQGARISRM